MKRPNREFVVFSMSAIDVFASALGAFILVTIILLPYYLKQDDVVNEQEKMRSQIAELQQLLEASDQALEQAKAEAAEAQAAADAALAELDRMKNDTGSTAAQLAQAEAKLREMEARARQAEQKASATTDALESSKQALSRAKAEIERRVKFALLGLSTNAETFLFVVDMSGSMQQYQGITIDTVRRMLEPMTNLEQVGILGFQAGEFMGNTRLHYWPQPGTIAPMTDGNRDLALNYTRGLMRMVSGKTPTLAGLLSALDYNVDAIFLLSDGAPTIPDGNWRRVVQEVTAKNRGRVEIHSVAIGPYFRDREFVDFLSELAKRNGGEFTGVATP